MERSRRGSQQDYGRDRYHHRERGRVADYGLYSREEKVCYQIARRLENGKVTHKERKPQSQVALNNRSSSLSSSSSSFSTRGSDKNVDREPGELSSGSDGNGVPYEVHSNGPMSPKPSPLQAKKRKYSPIVWDFDGKSPSKSYAADLNSALIAENDSTEKFEFLSEGENSPLQNYGDEDEYVPPRVLSASRWVDDNNFDSHAEEFGLKKRSSEEIMDKDPDLSPELGELREEKSTHSAQSMSSSVSNPEANASLSIGNSEKKEEAVEGVTHDTFIDLMDIDGRESRAINMSRGVQISQSSSNSDEDIDVDDDNDTDCTNKLVVEALLRKINMLQGCRSVDEFERLNRINEGTYGVVYRAKDKKTGEIVALKKVKMEKEREGFPLTSLREINILLSLHHPSIVDVKEVVVGNLDNIFMVMEYMDHDLKGLMEAMKQPFSQSEVKCLMLQLLEGVKCLHDNWVLHRAPELLLGEKLYSTAIDMWSVGCIMAEMLSKQPLFCGKTEIDQLDKIYRVLGTPNEMIWPGYAKLPGVKCNFVKQPYNKLRERFPKFTATFTGKPALSDDGFDLLNKLLTYDPEKRITAEDALNHDWFREFPPPKSREFMPTFPAIHEQDRRLWRVTKSPDPLEELRKIELQKGESLGEPETVQYSKSPCIPSPTTSADFEEIKKQKIGDSCMVFYDSSPRSHQLHYSMQLAQEDVGVRRMEIVSFILEELD